MAKNVFVKPNEQSDACISSAMARKRRIESKIIMALMALLLCAVGINCNAESNNENTNENGMKKILFINGSPNKNGNTATMAAALLEGHKYETLNLCDYRIGFYGQTIEGDQLEEVIAKMKEADVVVMGSPVYWHNICASVRTLMERFYGYVPEGTFSGKQLFFIYQGAAPTKMMIEDGEYSMSRFASMYGFTYEGMATSKAEAKTLNDKLR